MLLAFSIVDFATLGFSLALLLVIGSYFSSQQTSSREFLLARRSFGWIPAGLSLTATVLPAVGLLALASIAYWDGLKPIVLIVAAWLSALLLIPNVLPLLRNLELVSIYEYLELRFSPTVRRTALGVFMIWRMLFAGCILYVPCQMLGAAFQSEMAAFVFMIVCGTLAIFYVYLGGLRAVVWTDVAAVGLLFAALVLAVLSSGSQSDPGQLGVWETAEQLQRGTAIQLTSPAESQWQEQRWLIWAALPASLIWLLSYYMADQTTALRFLAVRDATEAKRAMLLQCAAASVLIPLASYLGLCMLAYFQNHPEDLRPFWVVNAAVDSDGELLKDPQTGQAWVRSDTDFSQQLDALIAARAILDPNTNEPAADASLFRDASGNFDPARLATIDPIPNTPAAEVRIRRGQDEILPQFLGTVLPPGVLGLFFGALLLAALAAFDSNIHAAAGLVYSELYERLGWGQNALARFRNKTPSQLDGQDELWLVRGLVLLVGAAAVVVALILSMMPDKFSLLLGIVATLGGPLLAVFLLGVFTRSTTAASAQLSLVIGTVFAFALSMWAVVQYPAPRSAIEPIWPIAVSWLSTLVFGFLASFALGRRKSRDELKGLVYGLGKLGIRPDVIEDALEEEPSTTGSTRWR